MKRFWKFHALSWKFLKKQVRGIRLHQRILPESNQNAISMNGTQSHIRE